ncbi:unnamed protein product [Lactuca saligna]|uniref:SWIM-type domain-containing protein n=1 Tax=Lactuca saligna TaxID=75948 RepID=A0AA36EJP8_LACSI|nr:unnamed protein product [Lactuca saligna]
MEEFGEDIKSWHAVPSGVNEYDVRNGFQNYGVNLKEKICACRLWELSGIPCVHAQVAILKKQVTLSPFHPFKGGCQEGLVLKEEDMFQKIKTRTKKGSRSGGRVGGGRSRGGGRGSSGRGNRGGGRGSSEGVQTEYGEGTSEFPKCEPEVVVIPNVKSENVESENDASPDFHNHISLTTDNLRKSLYTTEEVMDCLGLSEAELEQIEGLGLSEAEVQQIEDVDVAMSQDVGIASQITVEELPTNQVLGDEEMMNG